jgi:hypothetical protein
MMNVQAASRLPFRSSVHNSSLIIQHSSFPIMHRHILAASAVVLLLGAVVVGWWRPEDENVLAFCWRAGAILGAAWLAYDDVQRLPNWLLLLLPVLLIVAVRWSKLLIWIIPALVIWAILRRILWPRS